MRLPENTDTRRKVSVFKANQIKDSGAEYVCSPCVVCVLTLQDTCTTYDLAKQPGDRMSIMLFEVVYDAMVKALVKRGELDRIRIPIAFEGKSEEYIATHSVAGKMYKLLQNKEMATRILNWLEQDDVVKRYAKVNPGVNEQLDRFREMVNAETLDYCQPRKKPLTKPIMVDLLSDSADVEAVVQ
jgi:hypothetical protein